MVSPGAVPPPPPASVNPVEAVKMPAILLMVTAGIGGALQIVGLLMNILGVGLGAAAAEGGEEQAFNALSGGIGIVMNLVGLAVAGFIIFGALQMKGLKSYGLAMAVSIIAMIPCVSPCCILGLPFGIWALVVLMKPEVKAAFQ